FRRHGAGTALMEAAVAFAEEVGVLHVGTPVIAASRESNRFLARLSFSPAAVLRVSPTTTVRSRLTALRPSQRGGAGQIDRILAVRRQRRRDGVAS
ncbi:MAG: GNAT family N-acetyltransferase, partial [Nocardioides sp.]